MKQSLSKPEIACQLHRDERAIPVLGRILVVVDPTAAAASAGDGRRVAPALGVFGSRRHGRADPGGNRLRHAGHQAAGIREPAPGQ